MQSLLRDRDCIRFTDGKHINLNLLKNQIDRRVLKITALVNNLPTGNEKENERRLYSDFACQAALENESIFIDFSGCSKKVLGKLNSNQLYAQEQRRRQPKYEEKGDNSYLIMRESLDADNSMVQTKQPEKTEKQENPFEHSQMNLSDELNLDLSNIQFDDNVSYEDQANDIKSYIRTTLSNRKKMSMTDRSKMQTQLKTRTQRLMVKKSIVEPQEMKAKEMNRIIVGSECIDKMQAELINLIKQKRLYQGDNKLRMNLLKKVEQKFKNDI